MASKEKIRNKSKERIQKRSLVKAKGKDAAKTTTVKKPPSKRKKEKTKDNSKEENENTKESTNTKSKIPSKSDPPKKPQEKDEGKSRATSIITSAVPNANRAKWCDALVERGLKPYSKDFITNKKIKPTEFTTVVCEAHETKNRYNDILCVDQTRVVLKERPSADDYIHANWVPCGQQKYICTQGPIQETLVDFWHMIFTEKAAVIIMSCNFVEGGNEKVTQYFPKSTSDAAMTIGPFSISTKEDKGEPWDGIKCVLLECAKDGKKHSVVYYGIPSWADHTAPTSPTPTVSMIRTAREKAAGAPIVVHCSAGVGRSATVIAIDFGYQKIKENGEYSMIEGLKELRGCRLGCIQSAIQYIFIHVCMLEYSVAENHFSRGPKLDAFYEGYKAMNEAWVKRNKDRGNLKE